MRIVTYSRVNPRMRKALLVIVILVGVLGGVQVYYHRFDCGKEVVEYGDLAIEQVITTTPYRDWKGNFSRGQREKDGWGLSDQACVVLSSGAKWNKGEGERSKPTNDAGLLSIKFQAASF